VKWQIWYLFSYNSYWRSWESVARGHINYCFDRSNSEIPGFGLTANVESTILRTLYYVMICRFSFSSAECCELLLQRNVVVCFPPTCKDAGCNQRRRTSHKQVVLASTSEVHVHQFCICTHNNKTNCCFLSDRILQCKNSNFLKNT
jgi:hypothetical protein